MILEPVAVPAGAAVLDLLPRLTAALAGGAPILPYAAYAPPPPVPPHDPRTLPPDLAVAVGTSGTTGSPKWAMLSVTALRTSSKATLERLGGPGQWLLPLPANHIAGLQVLLRSVLADTTPVVLDPTGGFTAKAFAAAATRLDPGVRRYTSLVPTQLVRLLHDPAGGAALAGLDAVLVGGAALPLPVRRDAERAGVRVVATYGMSETAGGCVYDGWPLSGSAARVEYGRIVLGGATVAHGYLGRPDLTDDVFGLDADVLAPGVRWFRTDDLGHLDDGGRLHVDGRVDEVIVTGGLKVGPRLVEDALVEHVSDVREAVVLGVPDRRWGAVVGALVVLDPEAVRRTMTVADARAALRGILPDYALPRRLRVAVEVPRTGPGKPDRRAILASLAVGE